MGSALESGPTYLGEPMDAGPEALGELRRSGEIARDPEAQRRRLAEDGYLFLPGLLRRGEVLEARREVLRRLASRGVVDDAGHPLMDGVVLPGADLGNAHDLARENAPLDRVLYDGPMIAFYEGLLGGPVRHFDYTWFRAKMPGPAVTQPHYDIVFMGPRDEGPADLLDAPRRRPVRARRTPRPRGLPSPGGGAPHLRRRRRGRVLREPGRRRPHRPPRPAPRAAS